MGSRKLRHGQQPRSDIQTFSNILGLGQKFVDEVLTIRAGGSNIVGDWLTCRPGEASKDGQRWWYGHHGDPKLFATFTALVNMDGDWMKNVWDAQSIERDYLLAGPTMAARERRKAEDIPFADSDANQLTEKELVQSLNACTMHWKHDWEVQPRLPIKYEQDKFDEVFQETGIAVLQFAKGEELKKFQDEAIDRATRLPKITIHNETEVIESETTTLSWGKSLILGPPLRSTAHECKLICRKGSQCLALHSLSSTFHKRKLR